MKLTDSAVGLKPLLLLFWAVWTAIVCLTNILDVGKVLGVLPANWAFASGNYAFMVTVTGKLGLGWLTPVLFGGVVLWEGLGATLFGLAFARVRRSANQPFVATAFLVNLALWMAFMLADEIFIEYPVEGTHRSLFMAQLMSLLAIRLLPDG